VAAQEEQSATINEVAKNMGDTSMAASTIVQNVTESVEGISEISNSINPNHAIGILYRAVFYRGNDIKKAITQKVKRNEVRRFDNSL
jgi:hypothetical protein